MVSFQDFFWDLSFLRDFLHDKDLCIGCGGCEFICPVRPDKAIIVNGLAIHERAQKIILGQENTIRKIEVEFPF